MKNPLENLFGYKNVSKEKEPEVDSGFLDGENYFKNIKEKISSIGKTALLASLTYFSSQKVEAQNFTQLNQEEMSKRIELLSLDENVSYEKIKQHFRDSDKEEKIVLVKRDAKTNEEYARTTYKYSWKPGEESDTLSYIKIFPSLDISGEYDTLQNIVVLKSDSSLEINSSFEGSVVTILDFDKNGVLEKEWNAGEIYILDAENQKESGQYNEASVLVDHFSKELRNIVEGVPEKKEESPKTHKKQRKSS